MTSAKFLLALLAVGLTAGVGYCQFLEAVVPTGDTPTWIVWSPAVNKVYCSNEQDASITVISGESNEVVATIQVGDYPSFLCFNGDGTKLYCARGEEDALVVIDAIADTVLKTVSIPYYPGHMVYNATMNKLYISCNDDPVYRITVLDAVADTVLRHIPVRGVGRLLWHPLTNRTFCYSDLDSDTAKVIDCQTDEITVVIPVDNGGYFLGSWCTSPVNGLVYLAGRRCVYVLTPIGDSLVATVPVFGRDLELGPYPNKVFAVSGATFAIDGNTNTVCDSVAVPGSQLACDTLRGRLYSVHLNGRLLYVIDARADSLIKTIPLGRYPVRLCHNRIDSRTYISDMMDNVVYVIRDTSTAVAEEVPRDQWTQSGARVVAKAIAWLHERPGRLLDMNGREVAELRRGRNNLSHLAPGVYVVFEAQRRPLGKVTIVR